MKILISLVLLSSVIAEVYRLPILHWITLVDFMASISFFIWIIWLFFKRGRIKFFKWFRPYLFFLIICWISLFLNIWELSLNFSESLNSIMYLARFVFISFLAFLTFNLTKKDKKFVLFFLFFTSLLIVLFWFVQLKFYWNFDSLNMEDVWWDPHIWRMLSTWYDPNYLGWYFVFIFSLWVWYLFEKIKNNKKIRLLLMCILVLLLIWVIFTLSRSSLLALIVSWFVLWLFLSRKLLIIGLIVLFIWISLSSRMQERFLSWVESAKALVFSSQHALDPTAKLRVDSWKTWIEIYLDNPIIWVWFNTLPVVQKKYWAYIKPHASSWIDSSMLTIIATTWMLGLFPFLMFLFSVLREAMRNFYRNESWYSIWLFAWIFGIFIHSFFVNTLFFYAFIPSFFVAIWLMHRE